MSETKREEASGAEDGCGPLALSIQGRVTEDGYPYELLDALICKATRDVNREGKCAEHDALSAVMLYKEVLRRLVRDSETQRAQRAVQP